MLHRRSDGPLSAGCSKTTTCFLVCAGTWWQAPIRSSAETNARALSDTPKIQATDAALVRAAAFVKQERNAEALAATERIMAANAALLQDAAVRIYASATPCIRLRLLMWCSVALRGLVVIIRYGGEDTGGRIPC